MIITIDEYKISPYYKPTQTEATIVELIPSIEEEYLAIRNIPFLRITGDLVSGSKVISDISNFSDLQIRQMVSGTNIRGYITAINESNDDILVDKNATATEADATLTIYPIGAKLVAARMINYIMENAGDTGMKSEQIGDYQYERFDSDKMINGYPKTIVGSISRYAKARN
jgi:hypothetical protein